MVKSILSSAAAFKRKHIPGIMTPMFVWRGLHKVFKKKRIVTEDGMTLDLDEMDSCLHSLLAYNPEEVAWIKSIVKPGALCLDCGGHIGFYATLLSKLVGPEGLVLVFEPDQTNFNLLKKNLAQNDCANVQAHPVAVGDEEKTVRFSVSTVNSGNNTVSSTGGVSVQMYRLDRFVTDKVPDFVKMDVEGYELKVLRGMSFNPKHMLVEYLPEGLREAGENPEDLLKELERRGYSTRYIDEGPYGNLLCSLKTS